MPDEFVFDPKDLIGPPFRTCSKCGKDAEGLLSVDSLRYTRRCGECRNTIPIALPALRKRVLYLDQFAVSETMKSVNPATKANKEGRVDPYWKELFGRLERCCKLQLLVCPTSELHWAESMVTSAESALRRIYEHFSGGTRFSDFDKIEFVQVEADVKAWLIDPTAPTPQLVPTKAVDGNLDGWWNTINVSVGYKPAELEKIGDIVRAERNQIHDVMAKNFARWQTAKPSFNDQLTKGLETLENLRKELTRASLGRAGVDEGQIEGQTLAYIKSGRFRKLPWVRLSSLLYASLARRAASGGQTKPPDRGTVNDFKMVAYLLPYCDAIILDRRCHAYLREEPMRSELAQFPCRIVSADSRDDLINYLDGVLAAATKDHLELVQRVYGEGWDKPYDTMFE